MMARTGPRGRWSVAVFLLLMCVDVSAATPKPDLLEKQCPPGDFLNKNGTCCNRCAAGFRLKAECQAEGQRSVCEPCPDRQFNDQINHAPTCRKCRTCRASRNEYQEFACRNNQNTICRCNKGYYKSHIDSETYECLKCKQCGENEKINKECTAEANTVCECKENYHRVKNKCEPCRNCTTDCAEHCVKVTQVVTEGPKEHNNLLINIVAGCAAVVFVLLLTVVFITFMATKRFTKKKMLSQSFQPTDVSKETSELLVVNVTEPAADLSLKAAVPSPVSEQDSSKLPDCVPLEIRIPDLIYTVLDLVPVSQVKQLVRSLGVRDTEIEQAEADHRFCREAQYQMLRVWAERGVRGGKGEMLHRPLLEDLLDKLRQMHLGWAAEELETKYSIQ